MAKPDIGGIAERLFMDFIAPLVLGGAMKPGKPIGGKSALAIGADRPLGDPDRLSHVQLGRVRVGRKIAPIDRFEPFSAAEWAIAAVLHDIVQTSHPGFRGAFRKRGPERLLVIADKTLEQIAAPGSVGDALSRHSIFSRLFEITRTDVVVSWWTGSQTFLGADPPGRLTAWPEIRRVQQNKTPRPLMELPTSGGVVDPMRYGMTLGELLRKTPLTDLATCDRAVPLFAWSAETLALVSTRGGRTLVLRALQAAPAAAVDTALGRATKQLVAGRAWRALSSAIDLLGERSLAQAEALLSGKDEPEPLSLGPDADAAFARGAGALAARRFIGLAGGCFGESERKRLLDLLGPAATSAAAKELERMMTT